MALQGKRKNYSEQQVEDKSNEIVSSSTDKIVFTTHYSKDLDWFRSFHNVAVKNGRTLVISPKNAYLLGKLVHDKHLDITDPIKDKFILVYCKRK